MSAPVDIPLGPLDETRKIFVANMAYSWSSQEIRDWFSRFGMVNHVKLIYDNKQQGINKFKGFGFLYMQTREGHDAVLEYVRSQNQNDRIAMMGRSNVHITLHDEQRRGSGNHQHQNEPRGHSHAAPSAGGTLYQQPYYHSNGNGGPVPPPPIIAGAANANATANNHANYASQSQPQPLLPPAGPSPYGPPSVTQDYVPQQQHQQQPSNQDYAPPPLQQQQSAHPIYLHDYPQQQHQSQTNNYPQQPSLNDGGGGGGPPNNNNNASSSLYYYDAVSGGGTNAPPPQQPVYSNHQSSPAQQAGGYPTTLTPMTTDHHQHSTNHSAYASYSNSTGGTHHHPMTPQQYNNTSNVNVNVNAPQQQMVPPPPPPQPYQTLQNQQQPQPVPGLYPQQQPPVHLNSTDPYGVVAPVVGSSTTSLTTQCFVENLPRDSQPHDLVPFLSGLLGKVTTTKQCTMEYDPDPNANWCYAHIEFDSVQDASMMIQMSRHGNLIFRGRHMTVSQDLNPPPPLSTTNANANLVRSGHVRPPPPPPSYHTQPTGAFHSHGPTGAATHTYTHAPSNKPPGPSDPRGLQQSQGGGGRGGGGSYGRSGGRNNHRQSHHGGGKVSRGGYNGNGNSHRSNQPY